jgi:hypothetical protein
VAGGVATVQAHSRRITFDRLFASTLTALGIAEQQVGLVMIRIRREQPSA